MVLFFSATGNTEYIAKNIAALTDDTCINLLDRIKNKDYSRLVSRKPFVICMPVYVCEPPRFLIEHLARQVFAGNRRVYCIFTSGGYAGISGKLMKSLFKHKKMTYAGHAEFKMPNNYIASDMYSEPEDDEIHSRIAGSTERLKDVADTISSSGRLKARHIFLFEILITVPFTPVWSRLFFKTNKFYAKDNCIGCGKCTHACPLNNIKLINKRPAWGNTCTHCMACICNCPVEAIEYGDITQEKVKYHISKYLA